MIKIPYDQIIEKIKTEKNLSSEQVEHEIKQRMEQLSGLVSKEGAAHILANEMGVKLSAPVGELKISALYAGIRTGDILGRVVRKFEVRDFTAGERKGKVGSFIIGDETGSVRVTCWNDQTKEMDTIVEEDIVLISDGAVRENRGALEVHLTEKTKIIRNPEGKSVPLVEKKQVLVVRKQITALQEGDMNVEVFGTVVQVYDLKFFERCLVCRKKIKQSEAGWQCAEHGLLKEPDYGYLINLVLDDGSGNIRVVFFGQQVQELLKKPDNEVQLYRESQQSKDKVKTDLLGEMMKISGKAVKNQMTARLEFIANKVDMVINAEEEITRLQNELQEGTV